MRPFIILLCLSLRALAQTDMPTPKPFPLPMIETALSLNGDGYTAVTPDIHPGIDWETSHWMLLATADYTFAGKSDYGAGHSRSIVGDLGYKINAHWMALGGVTWGKTYSQQFDKSVSSWHAGAGHDWLQYDFSARFTAEYARQFNERTSYPSQPGCTNCGNNLAGVVMNFWEPSPYTDHRWFFHIASGVNWFQPSQVPGATSKTWTLSGGSTFGLVFRF